MNEPRYSVAYRKERERIIAGKIPEKYRRVAKYVTGPKVVEIGSAEGVLALTLAREGKSVKALELRQERHDEAVKLMEEWASRGAEVEGCELLLGDIRERLDLLQGADTLVAVRSIYYLRGDAPSVIAAAAAARVKQVVLCGNGNRAAQYKSDPNSELGQFNKLASVLGMTRLLQGAGYTLDTIRHDGDPIVTGYLS